MVHILKNYPSLPVDELHLENTINMAAAGIRRDQEQQRTSFGEFYLAQLRFIHWKIWLIHVLIVIGTGLLLHHYIHEQRGAIQLIMLASMAAPLLVMAGIQTLTRSLTHHTLEIEVSTRYSLDKLIIVRLSIMGIADLMGLLTLAILSNVWIEMDLINMLLYLLVPFNITCFGCLWLLNRVRNMNCRYYCVTYACLITIMQFIWMLNPPSINLYNTTSRWIWLLILLTSSIGIGLETNRIKLTFRSLDTP